MPKYLRITQQNLILRKKKFCKEGWRWIEGKFLLIAESGKSARNRKIKKKLRKIYETFFEVENQNMFCFCRSGHNGPTTFRITTFRITTFSITTLCITIKMPGQRMRSVLMLSFMKNIAIKPVVLSVVLKLSRCVECHYNKCRYADCQGACLTAFKSFFQQSCKYCKKNKHSNFKI